MENRKADIFLKLADSLSKYRRAELKNNEKNLIEELYVDPLDNDLILKSMLQENTTLLIGRKGTGKSTIINRFQHEIRKTDDKISLYIDVKALFEQAKKSSFSFQYEMENILSSSDRKFRIERVFDFNKLLTNWINNSKELICSNCNKKYPLEQKDIFFKHKYPCLKCNKGKVILKPIIDDIQKEKINKKKSKT